MPPAEQQGEPSPIGVRLIVAYKVVKATIELAAAVAIPLIVTRGLPNDVIQVIQVLHDHLSAKWGHLFNAVLTAGTWPHLRLLMIALAADGVSSLVEGWAVWRRRPWAPWLIVIATGGLVPMEVVLILDRPTAAKIAILAVNVATVAYMIRARIKARHAPAAPVRPRRRRLRSVLAVGAVGVLAGYLGLAYAALPWLLEHRQARHSVSVAPDRTVDATGRPSDPLNVGLVGTREDVFASMQAAGWVEAKALSRRSAAGIAVDAVLDRSDPDAPVSTLFFEGRRQDLAFEQQVGGSPRRRHHVRLWQHPRTTVAGRPLWLGAATFDRRVGLAHGTGEITHVIDPDIDVERDKLIADLVRCHCAISVHRVRGVGPIPEHRHGRVTTDGMTAVAVLRRP
jgi:uncharacterized membrane protein (DUF2068 family)